LVDVGLLLLWRWSLSLKHTLVLGHHYIFDALNDAALRFYKLFGGGIKLTAKLNESCGLVKLATKFFKRHK